MDFTNRELEVIGKLVDASRDGIASKLIHLEAVAPKLDAIHKRYYKAWEEHLELSEKLDVMRGITSTTGKVQKWNLNVINANTEECIIWIILVKNV